MVVKENFKDSLRLTERVFISENLTNLWTLCTTTQKAHNFLILGVSFLYYRYSKSRLFSPNLDLASRAAILRLNYGEYRFQCDRKIIMKRLLTCEVITNTSGAPHCGVQLAVTINQPVSPADISKRFCPAYLYVPLENN